MPVAALDALYLMALGERGLVRIEWSEDGRREHVLVDDAARFRRLVLALAGRHDVWVGVQSRSPEHGGLTGRCHVLWCVAEGRRSCTSLTRMRPRPTLLLQQGETARMTGLWALREGLTWEWTVRANRRLAHWIRGPKRYVEPEHVVRPPGSWVREGRLLPLRVRSTLHPEWYRAREVVGRLPDAPDPDAWRKRREAA